MIKKGSKVRVHYTGKFENDKIFDSSVENEPLEVVIGQSNLIKGFEEGLMGMEEGEKKTINIEPKDAYGEHIEGRVQEVEKTKLPDEVKVGMVMEAQSESGSVILSIKEIKEDVVVLDTNHPLSGKKLIFDLDVVEVTNE